LRLTRYTHACVTLEHEGIVLLLDPGSFTPEVRELLARADAVLVTHDHFDHFDAEAVRAELARRSSITIYGPRGVMAALDPDNREQGQTVQVDGGERLNICGIGVDVVGGPHAEIHEGIAVPHNVGYVVGGALYHPGDAYRVPTVSVSTLLVPVSGPWVKLGDAIDFIIAVAPQRTIPVHDVMLSDVGRRSVAMFLGEGALTGTPLLDLAAGESIDL
jgi:L-ascorbate metabolism protein UlaG (beta-lactamase superfamily)